MRLLDTFRAMLALDPPPAEVAPRAPEPDPAPEPEAAPAPEPAPAPAPNPAPTLAQKAGAARHVARFARAIEACEAALPRGESAQAELDGLRYWQRYYTALAALEAGEI